MYLSVPLSLSPSVCLLLSVSLSFSLTAVIGESAILLSLSEDHRPSILSLLSKKLSGSPLPLSLTQTDSGKKLEKLSNADPKVI